MLRERIQPPLAYTYIWAGIVTLVVETVGYKAY